MSLPEFFLDRVTADIRQQMDGVLALTEQLARQRLTSDAQACVTGVTEAALGVRRMLDSALDLKAVGAEGPKLDAAPVRLRELMDAIQERWQGRAAQAGVTLLVSYDGAPDAAVVSDRARLAQMFDGFVGDALAGISRGAMEVSLKVSACPVGLALQGRVRGPRDPAWDKQDLEARVRGVEARFGLEVALGVLLARRVITAMSGSVRQETSANAAETVVFDVQLPALIATPETHETAAARTAHVLVVDDNATNRMVAQALVEMFDCTSEAAQDGLEAVDAARSGRFDLILMDIKMPRMDGVSAARAIRALPGRIGATPIIALTANADPDDAAGYLAAGMNGVVEKPMKPEHLLRALQAALAEPGAATAAAAA
ncbi:response regulator [Phenylobacterium sp.]|uniref:response regulator n=1 Tax=Phenylobacterium sp. TaxID=1871053 RepID=UPI0039833080